MLAAQICGAIERGTPKQVCLHITTLFEIVIKRSKSAYQCAFVDQPAVCCKGNSIDQFDASMMGDCERPTRFGTP
jgi:hypothetical protein